MKKTTLIMFSLLFSTVGFSQSQILDVIGGSQPGNLYRNAFVSIPLKDIEGTQYFNDNFKMGSIEGVIDNVFVRYNANTDEVEFKKNEAVYNLSKKEKVTSVYIKELNYKLRLLNYINSDRNEVNGYLVEVSSENGVSLLRRDKIVFVEAKTARNSYGEDVPAKFQKQDSEYYLELVDKKIVLFPKSKKDFIKLFPSQKDKIEDYFKKNDTSFKNEFKLIDLTKFIATF